ncbi:c-type cytochrome [Shimia abyssi]|uniref:Cytochrome c n=1 Tax=Shimia abyssi TaxID=1662395 RepID=A0A2P8FAH3_9RHOB|nr:c-type cytochrome [Shimia abyssi]PSL18720.1 cytochrome c [Shimia abyssi]
MRLGGIVLSLLLAPGLALAGDFFTLEGHGGPIKGIAVSPSGDRILTASFDNSLGYWRDQAPSWLEAHEAAANTVRFVVDTVAVSAGDDFAVLLWDLQTGTATRLGAHKGKVISLRVSPDGKTIATASWDGTVGIWPLDGGKPRFIPVASNVNDIAFLDGGAGLMTAAADGKIREWDVKTGAQKRLFLSNGFGVNTLVAHEKAGWLAFGAVDGVTRIVDIESAETIKDVTLDRRPILAMAASRDMRYLAIGDGEGYIMVLDTAEWAIHADFRATHRGPIWALEFAADGENIHAGGLDDAMFSWPLNGTRDAPRMVSQDRPFLNGSQNATNGERQFQRKCSICHTLTETSARRAGPTLMNVFGRPAGTVPDYFYSQTLTTSDIIWGPATIDALFDLGPDVYIKGTKMPVQRITSPQDRADLIDYLRRFSETKEN